MNLYDINTTKKFLALKILYESLKICQKVSNNIQSLTKVQPFTAG